MDAGEAIFALLFVVVGIGSLVFWVYALVDAIRVPDDSRYRAGTKVIWVLVIALTGVIGAIIYFAVGRPSRAAVT